MTTTTTDTAVSRNCAAGRHHRCLGAVAVYPPAEGRTLVPCGCPTPDCGHGPPQPAR